MRDDSNKPARERREHPGDGAGNPPHPGKDAVNSSESGRAMASVTADGSFASSQPPAYDWVRAAKAASRAVAVLSSWNGAGPSEDAEAAEVLGAFAQDVQSKGDVVADLACDMLMSKVMSAKCAGPKSDAWSRVVDKAVQGLDGHGRQRMRAALRHRPSRAGQMASMA